MKKVLIVDDDKSIRHVFREFLEKSGFSTLEAQDGNAAIEVFKRDRPESVLLDYKMPGMDGLETMAELKKIDPAVPIVMVTGRGDVSVAVEAIKAGAYDFVAKPPDIDALILTIKRATEKLDLERVVSKLNSTVGASMEYLLGRSAPIKKIISEIIQVASSNFSVIIQGETGSGKSTVAELIHRLSKRSEGQFTRVDIGVIAETLVESELFGYEKGAFTGAERSKKGYFEIANKGTIFIDELQNMSGSVQSKLLGAVEEGRIYPVGSAKPVEIDVRIISATNTDIKRLVEEKRFREDLFFRLGEFIITLPPLRDRTGEIPSFATKFSVEACSELDKPMVEISDDALNLLVNHTWPGNIRELKNVIRRAVLLSDGTVILPEHIEFLMTSPGEYDASCSALPLKEISSAAARNAEKAAIEKVLVISKGNKSKAASILQVDYKTILSKIKQYGIK
jgi:DNA-binding NtrC family response regulator